MSGYLAQWYDPVLDVPAEVSVEQLTKEEVARLAKLLAVATTAGGLPRRVGGDAEPAELALDKKRCKRVGHVAAQLLAAWNGKGKVPPVPDVSREAAVVDWKRWWDEHQTWLDNRRRYIATWCQRFDGDEKWCKSALVKLNNELQWIEYALRD